MNGSFLREEMEEKSPNSLASAFLGENAFVNAVASLLSKQQTISKDDVMPSNAPLLVLGNHEMKDVTEDNGILGSSQGHSPTKSNKADVFLPSLEQVHALATANLLASTQRDIVQQLAEASLPRLTPESEKRQHAGKCSPNKKDSKSALKSEDEDKKRSRVVSEMTPSPPEVKALVCSFEGCNRKFAWLTHLKYHEMTHTNNRQFECPDENCRKTFFTAQRLKVHLQTHTGERPFKCHHADCGKTFTTAGNLKNHERIHTGEQPYACDFGGCNRRFTEYSSLHKHKLIHSGDKPFECKVCNKKFTQSGSRRQHLIRHHLDEEIRNSLKNSGYKKISRDKEEKIDSGAKRKEEPPMKTMSKKRPTAVTCSPQLMVLSNTYYSHPTSESIVLSHGLNEHIVRVTTDSHHHLTDAGGISLSHSLLSSDGMLDESLAGRSDDLVTLSQVPIFHHKDDTGSIVYTTDILDQTDVNAHTASYQVDAASVTPVSYQQHSPGQATVQTDVSLHHSVEAHQSELYNGHDEYVSVVHHNDFQDPHVAYADVKEEMSGQYLTSEGEVLHSGVFIGRKEVTISASSSALAGVGVEDLAADTSFMSGKESLMDWSEHLHKH